jgi:hypothetical protein
MFTLFCGGGHLEFLIETEPSMLLGIFQWIGLVFNKAFNLVFQWIGLVFNKAFNVVFQWIGLVFFYLFKAS